MLQWMWKRIQDHESLKYSLDQSPILSGWQRRILWKMQSEYSWKTVYYPFGNGTSWWWRFSGWKFAYFSKRWSYLWGILGQWDTLLLNLTSIGFTNFFRCLIFDLSFFKCWCYNNQRWDILGNLWNRCRFYWLPLVSRFFYMFHLWVTLFYKCWCCKN